MGSKKSSGSVDPNRAPSVSLTLEGDAKDQFDRLRAHIAGKVPGVKPGNPDVLRYALYLAADTLAEIERSESFDAAGKAAFGGAGKEPAATDI